MPDILHDFPIATAIDAVFHGISAPDGLDQWWTSRSRGAPGLGADYELDFGPGYLWRAKIVEYRPPEAITFELTQAMPDWVGTRVEFELTPTSSVTQVRFRHTGWATRDDHYRTSSYCWAMYLRILRRYLELGETVPYERRLEV